MAEKDRGVPIRLKTITFYAIKSICYGRRPSAVEQPMIRRLFKSSFWFQVHMNKRWTASSIRTRKIGNDQTAIQSGLEVIKLFSCSDAAEHDFFLLIKS